MQNSTFRKIFVATAVFALLSVAALWSFNGLADLFGWPQAEYKHAIAGMVPILILKWSLSPHRGGGRRGIIHQHRGKSGEDACGQ